jgi:hypothetical protein
MPRDALAFDPAAHPFRPRFPWLNGDLQTLRNTLVRACVDLSPWPETRLELDLGDGDRLLAALHRPKAPRSGAVPLVLVHGLTGCEDSLYIRKSALHALERGRSVVRLNLRGAGPGRAAAAGHYHAGRSEDLRRALAGLAARLPELRDGAALVGYSLGGNMLLKLLGEGSLPVPVVAACSVSAPIDLKATQVRMMAPRNAPYHRFLLTRMKAESLADPAVLAEVETVWDFDERVVAPQNGFAGAEDYYARCAAKGYWRRIGVPTLIVAALDDPWIPGASYRAEPWGENPALSVLLPAHGGHVGFHGRGTRTPWHDLRFADFLETIEAGQPARSRSAAETA